MPPALPWLLAPTRLESIVVASLLAAQKSLYTIPTFQIRGLYTQAGGGVVGIFAAMATVKQRLGASILLVVFSLLATVIFLNRAPVSTQLEIIRLGASSHRLWGWSAGGQEQNDVEGGIRVVVFGDSWVGDGIEKGLEGKGKGKSWPEVLCDQVSLMFEIDGWICGMLVEKKRKEANHTR